jgi:tellurite resistance protein
MVHGTENTVLNLSSLELPKLEAVVELMFLAAYADGVVSDVERQVFVEHIESASQGQLGKEAIGMMLTHIGKALAGEGREARFDVIRRRLGDPRSRKVALGLAIQVLLADGFVDPREEAWLIRAATALEIDPNEAAEMLLADSPTTFGE